MQEIRDWDVRPLPVFIRCSAPSTYEVSLALPSVKSEIKLSGLCRSYGAAQDVADDLQEAWSACWLAKTDKVHRHMLHQDLENLKLRHEISVLKGRLKDLETADPVGT